MGTWGGGGVGGKRVRNIFFMISSKEKHFEKFSTKTFEYRCCQKTIYIEAVEFREVLHRTNLKKNKVKAAIEQRHSSNEAKSKENFW